MPDRLSLPSTLLLIVLAFGLAFAIQVPQGADSSAAESAVEASAPAAKAPSAEPDLSLTNAGAVPALLDPRQPGRRRARARKKAPSGRTVVNLPPRLAPAPVKLTTPARPTPTPVPIAPAAPRSTPTPKRKPTLPAPKPKAKPTPAPEPAGEFDTSGELSSGAGGSLAPPLHPRPPARIRRAESWLRLSPCS
jgi:hypothetical protein